MFIFLSILAILLAAVYYIFFLKNPKVAENEIVISVPPGTAVAALADTRIGLYAPALHFRLLPARSARRKTYMRDDTASLRDFPIRKLFAV